MPIALAGFVVLPDLPETTRAWFLTADERKLCVDRMLLEGRAQRKPYTKEKIKRILTSWHWWILVPMYACWNNGGASAQPVFAQHLKSFPNHKYSITQINVYPTFTNILQIFTTLAFAWTSDSILKGRRWPAVLIGGCTNIMCYASLWHWNISETWRWACYIMSGIGGSVAGLIMSWAHEICTGDNEERAIVTGSMNQMAYVFQMWLPLVAWQQVKQPRYTAGFTTLTFLNVGMIGFCLLAMYMQLRVRQGRIAN